MKIAQALSYGAEFVAVDGTYDDANRVASIIGDSKGIGIVNINMRPYYVEGSKTLAYEVAEQMNWQVPDSLIIPVGSGAMLNAICKGFEELHRLGFIGSIANLKIIAASLMDALLWLMLSREKVIALFQLKDLIQLLKVLQ